MSNTSHVITDNDILQNDEYLKFLQLKGGSLNAVYQCLKGYIQRRKNISEKRVSYQRKLILEKYYDNSFLASRWSQDILASKINRSKSYVNQLVKILEELGCLKKDIIKGKAYYILGKWKEVEGKKKETFFLDEVFKKKIKKMRVETAEKRTAFLLE